ncbi:hypothetical protein [Actinoplanes couchii]|uniref:Lipoprotein n=1 Tax=Actinoplanes couchii TaxID=403638 RepID=A0ABQ3XGG0_9ACTN|nr:hypothetical protein [Actinoplanes couchii]MDR6321060.1 hypothetical protein [Actinoplanes couchii]GID57571.1 hypothetical protein Aco03nite_059750 [Actinoplanes couchii]
MNHRIAAGTAAGAALATLLAGCSAGPPRNRADPAGALTLARTELEKDTYRLTTALGTTVLMTGVVDPVTRNSETVWTRARQDTTVRRIDGVNYVRFPPEQAGGDDRKWETVRTPEGGGLASFDASSILGSLATVAEPRWADYDTVEGVIDLTTFSESLGPSPAGIDPQPPRMVAFQADIEGRGRLAELRVTTASAVHAVTFSEFGTPVDVKVPPAADTYPD